MHRGGQGFESLCLHFAGHFFSNCFGFAENHLVCCLKERCSMAVRRTSSSHKGPDNRLNTAALLWMFTFFVWLLMIILAFEEEERTVGVLVNTGDAYDGYVLFSPIFTPDVYLIDNDGRVIHTWEIENTTGVLEAHLRENGNLVVVAAPRDDIDLSLIPSFVPDEFAGDGSIREYTWDNEFVQEYQFIGAEAHQHYGIDILPNGNILAIVKHYRSLDEALAMGLKPQFGAMFQEQPYLLTSIIIEIDLASNEIVWQWDAWDHLIQDVDPDLPNYGEISRHPHRIDINYQHWLRSTTSSSNHRLGAANWMYINAVAYSPELDQIILSSRTFDEFWIIDHGISTAEAAGSAGDLLWRWGNSAAYGQGDERSNYAYGGAYWIAAGLPGAGNILLYKNRDPVTTDEERSPIVELKPPLQDDGAYDWDQEAEIVRSYSNTIFSIPRTISDTQRLPNGNMLIVREWHGQVIEIDSDGEIVWQFVNPATRGGLIAQGDSPGPEDVDHYDRNLLFRVHKYPTDYPGFAGKDMTPGERLVD